MPVEMSQHNRHLQAVEKYRMHAQTLVGDSNMP